ncbi:MAG: DUF2971 domain-containing protein [Pseudomonadota bacterium]
MELNDPFEFLGADLSDPKRRKILKDTKSELAQTKGLLCFSENWNNPLLWGHYADKHKGICLGFDVSDHLLSKVAYVKERFPNPAVMDLQYMEKLLLTKFDHWAYEAEYRSFVALENHIDGLFYSNFSQDLKLKQVIVGDQSKITRIQLAEALGESADGTEVLKARPAFTSFDVTIQNNSTLWV